MNTLLHGSGGDARVAGSLSHGLVARWEAEGSSGPLDAEESKITLSSQVERGSLTVRPSSMMIGTIKTVDMMLAW